jgi:hypothetical protein
MVLGIEPRVLKHAMRSLCHWVHPQPKHSFWCYYTWFLCFSFQFFPFYRQRYNLFLTLDIVYSQLLYSHLHSYRFWQFLAVFKSKNNHVVWIKATLLPPSQSLFLVFIFYHLVLLAGYFVDNYRFFYRCILSDWGSGSCC